MVINTNLQAQSAATRLSQSSTMLAQSLQRLSSGSKITSPADDSAGLAQSMHLGAESARVDAASNNLGNAISFAQTQDAYLSKVNEALTRMSELTMMAMDVTKTDSDRALYNKEFKALGNMVFAIGEQTFNGVSLFSGAQMNVTTDPDGNTFAMAGVDMNRTNPTYFHAANNYISDYGECFTTTADFKVAMRQIVKDRATIGSNLESLTYYQSQMATLKNSLSASSSRITDVDMAEESTKYAKYNILTQAGTAMLAQANSLPQSVLKLLG